MPLLPGDPWAGYARTVVEIVRPAEGDLVVCPAPPGEVGEWPWRTADPVHLLTAWDPGLERPPAAENRRRQAELEAVLRPLAGGTWMAVGVDLVSGHREEGVAVVGVSQADALALGLRYDQTAIFAWTPAEWVVVGCADGRRVASGWTCTARGVVT